jgi:hypothetical protein
MFWIIPLTAAYWIYDGYNLLQFKTPAGSLRLSELLIHQVSNTTKLYCFFADLIPCTLLILLLSVISKLLKAFENLQFFSEQSIRYIRQLGYVLLISQLIYPIYLAWESYLLAGAAQLKNFCFFYHLDYKFLLVTLLIFIFARVLEYSSYLDKAHTITLHKDSSIT